MRFDILTLFTGFFSSPLKEGIIGRAVESGLIEVITHDIRDYAEDKRRTVDDAPYGGGSGMVLKVEPVVKAIEAAMGVGGEATVILTGPRGGAFNQKKALELKEKERIIIVCGRYEGVDERIRAFVDMELSIGDYVLTGGEVAALCIIDAVGRLIKGVVGDSDSLTVESFSKGLLEYPHYTRPYEFRGMRTPDVLLSGNHKEIEKWRHEEMLKKTFFSRRDLLEGAELTEDDKDFIKQLTIKD